MNRAHDTVAEPRRVVSGVLLLDKPRGMASNRALQTAKRLLHALKAGHTGSLDPMATGLLPLCFGEATKLTRFLLDADKRYWAVFRLGVSTATHDCDGDITRTRPVAVRRAALEQTLAGFVGEIEQIPPMYSALKHGGQALYRLARAGIEIERAPRRVRVHSLVLRSFEDDRLELEIECSKGTYIRSLAHDLGERLGCGAHVAELRRLAAGPLTIDRAVTLETLAERPTPEDRAQLLRPLDAMLAAIPGVRLSALAVHYLLRGQAVSTGHGQTPGWVRLYDNEDRFLGMGQVLDDGRVAPRRLMAQP